ncbi:hypothetical protein SPRG_01389 [Saprolegnia parasitica CBS 223.65]|uniref:FYVE-type domain-containing protein n=1 Tax=Saprolegnia parasitica (strain CBS 223.65) TaxID=695850 RepID=A0A067CUD9_SAPPC|nr:hypothetical protein SPRG_01389 [Saprolegnia parasitica CBS 223.65]KDO34118.1 hypothetical protein SPRG_01389 [Saprolegnia parasitica CBS 223.65]|eukprot:XP_012194996.1 hypothetical protein SPRG_01389 [Saprolegnia parasitica CBS 223.65]
MQSHPASRSFQTRWCHPSGADQSAGFPSANVAHFRLCAMPPPIAADDLLAAEQWVSFSERSCCASCAHAFSTVFRQKHNCQWCGEVVCGRCLVQRRAEALDTSFDVRICVDCVAVCEKHVHQDASCFVCTRRFSLLRRKYRCDECGEGVCKKCHVTKRDHTSASRAVRQVRVCTNCMLLRETAPKVCSVSAVSLLDSSVRHTMGDVPLPPTKTRGFTCSRATHYSIRRTRPRSTSTASWRGSSCGARWLV